MERRLFALLALAACGCWGFTDLPATKESGPAHPARKAAGVTAVRAGGSGRAARQADERDAAGPPRFDAKLEDGTVVGELVLGQTVRDRALWLYSRAHDETDRQMTDLRRTAMLRPVSQGDLDAVSRVRRLLNISTAEYRPWHSAQTLLFNDDKKLVALIDHADPLEGISLSRALDLYPDLQETARTTRGTFRRYEMQTEAAPGVRLILFFDPETNRAMAAAYLWTGSPPPR